MVAIEKLFTVKHTFECLMVFEQYFEYHATIDKYSES